MNTNEDYISNQIAVYKNSKTLLEFQDKLKVAPIASYAHIHANSEKGADGRRVHSLIGILMKDYSKGTGDNAVTVSANISPDEAKFIFTRLTAGFQEYSFQQDKIFGDKDEDGYAKVSKVRIIRAVKDSNIASDLYAELQDIKNRLWYQMPAKKIAFCDEDDCSQTAIAWFNTAAAMLSDTDMTELLEHENIYCADEWAEKQKRIATLNRLTKQQQMLLYTEVTGFITRYLELSAAFNTIEAVISELDYHQSAIKGKEDTTLPQTAYV